MNFSKRSFIVASILLGTSGLISCSGMIPHSQTCGQNEIYGGYADCTFLESTSDPKQLSTPSNQPCKNTKPDKQVIHQDSEHPNQELHEYTDCTLPELSITPES